MAIKSWNEMRKVDVTPFLQDVNGAPFLPWAKCIQLLHDNGAEKVFYERVTGPDGSTLIKTDKVFTDAKGNTNQCYEGKIRVTIDDLVFDYVYPVRKAGRVVKDTQMDSGSLSDAAARAFVKAVATYTGLGFGLWEKGDPDEEHEVDLTVQNVMLYKEKLQSVYTRLLQKHMTGPEIAEKCGMNWDQVKAVFTYPDFLADFEQKLMKI